MAGQFRGPAALLAVLLAFVRWRPVARSDTPDLVAIGTMSALLAAVPLLPPPLGHRAARGGMAAWVAILAGLTALWLADAWGSRLMVTGPRRVVAAQGERQG